MKKAFPLSLCLVMTFSPALLRAAAPGDELRESADAQSRIKTQTQSVGQQLDTIIAEFDRNGIVGEDVQTLRAIRNVLGNLSESQMQQVVDFLQKARSAPDADSQRRNVTQAVVGQKTISSQLSDLLKEYRRQQAMYELSARLDKLADRQNENFKASVQLAKATVGRKQENFTAPQTDMLKVQQAEQTALKEEIRQAVADMAAMNQKSQESPNRLAEASQQAREKKLEELAATAADDLQKGNVYRAATNEKNVRDQLRDLSRLVAPPKDKLQTLEDAAADVQKAIEQQEKLNAETKVAGTEDPAPEQKQADLVDKMNLTQRDIKDAAPTAADKLKAAEAQMQQARGGMAQNKKDDAAKNQDAALDNLKQAKAELDKQIEKEIAAADQPQDALAAVKDLLERTKQLRVDQGALTKTSTSATAPDPLKQASTKQEQLRGLAMGLQSDSLGESPEASPYFTTAAGKMARASRTLVDPTAASADKKAAIAEQQKQVDEALADAQKILEKKQEQLEQAQKDLAQVEKAKDDVAQLMQDQQKLNNETNKAAEESKEAPKPEQLASEQQQNKQDAQQAQQSMPQSAQPAQQAMQKAQSAMQQAQQQLAENQPKAATPPQQQAMQELSKAMDALNQQSQQLQEQLGQQPPKSPQEQRKSMEQLAQTIEKAQGEINKTSEKLPGKPEDAAKAKEAGKELEKTQSDLAKLAAEERDQLPGDAAKAVDEASEALSEAAAKADANKPGPAKENAQAAHDKLEAAKAALQLAMEGLTPGLPEMAQGGPPMPGQPMPGQPMPGGPPMPGAMPGEMPGPPGPNPDPKKGNEDGSKDMGSGPRGNERGSSTFAKLPERERQAIMSTGAAKYPEEYAPMIEQYLRNLSDESGR